jgi:hypothetical protein
MDDTIWAHQESKKRKVMAVPSDSAPHKYQIVCALRHHLPQQHQHRATCPPQLQHAALRALTPPLTVLHPRLPPPRDRTVSNTCYNCGHVGHFVQDCTAPRWNFAPCPRSHSSHLPRGPTKVVATRVGRVNYTIVQDVFEGEQVLADTFFLNGHPIIILFDSDTSHDFISKTCT